MTQHWFWPQYTAVSLYVLSVVMAAVLDGEPKTGKHSFATSVVGTAFSAWLLWCGGFFG
jgi:hypothetical protein